MNWEAIGAIGEIVGAVGVIVTLLFLTIQLRQNTKALRADSFRGVFEMGHSSTTMIIESPEISDLYLRGRQDYSSLSPSDQQRFHYLMAQRVHSIQSMFLYHEANDHKSIFGGMGASQIRRAVQDPGVLEWWEARGKAVFPEDFQSYVQEVIDSSEV